MQQYFEGNFNCIFSNVKQVELLHSLSTAQIVELFLETLSNTMENETVMINAVSSLLTSFEGQELDEFFDNFAQAAEEVNKFAV